MRLPDDETEKATFRRSIVDGLLRAIGAGGSLIDAIADCGDYSAARQTLIQPPWNFFEVVAHHILDMPYRRTTALSRQNLRNERDELIRLIGDARNDPGGTAP